jgi:hypothetical protein
MLPFFGSGFEAVLSGAAGKIFLQVAARIDVFDGAVFIQS